jgi:hypothetical protein
VCVHVCNYHAFFTHRGETARVYHSALRALVDRHIQGVGRQRLVLPLPEQHLFTSRERLVLLLSQQYLFAPRECRVLM